MPDLRGLRILIAEDEYLLACEMEQEAETAGAIVVGPVASLDEVNRLTEERAFDAAILDINLSGEYVYPVADILLQRAVPFLFLTGYSRAAVPERFSGVPHCNKPVSSLEVLETLAR